MGRWFWIAPLVGFALFTALIAAYGCPAGTEAFKDTCVVEIAPEIAEAVKPSDEKPPADKMPSYQREGIHVVDAPNMQAEDARLDQEKIEATAAGKKAAGIR